MQSSADANIYGLTATQVTAIANVTVDDTTNLVTPNGTTIPTGIDILDNFPSSGNVPGRVIALRDAHTPPTASGNIAAPALTDNATFDVGTPRIPATSNAGTTLTIVFGDDFLDAGTNWTPVAPDATRGQRLGINVAGSGPNTRLRRADVSDFYDVGDRLFLTNGSGADFVVEIVAWRTLTAGDNIFGVNFETDADRTAFRALGDHPSGFSIFSANSVTQTATEPGLYEFIAPDATTAPNGYWTRIS